MEDRLLAMEKNLQTQTRMLKDISNICIKENQKHTKSFLLGVAEKHQSVQTAVPNP